MSIILPALVLYVGQPACGGGAASPVDDVGSGGGGGRNSGSGGAGTGAIDALGTGGGSFSASGGRSASGGAFGTAGVGVGPVPVRCDGRWETTRGGVCEGPLPPTTFNFAPDGSGQTSSSVGFTWSPVGGAASYRAFSRPKGGNWSMHGETTQTSYTFTGLSPRTEYFTQIVSVDASGVMGPNTQDPADSSVGIWTRIAAVTNLRATSVAPNKIDLAWDPIPGASTYSIFRGPGIAARSSDVQVSTNSHTYADPVVAPNTSYSFVVRANGGNFEPQGEASTELQVSTPPMTSNIPSALVVSSYGAVDSAGYTVNLTWTAPTSASGATAYKLYRAPAFNGPFALVGIFTGASASDSGLPYGVYHHYAVAAVVGGTEHERSSPTQAFLPPAPTAVLTSSPTANSLTINWTGSSQASGYRVYIFDGTTELSVYKTSSGCPMGCTFPATGLNYGGTYSFRVRGLNGAGNAGMYAATSGTTMAGLGPNDPVNPPTAVSAVPNATGSGITLTWTNPASAPAQYEMVVLVRPTGVGTFQPYAAVSRLFNPFPMFYLEPGRAYDVILGTVDLSTGRRADAAVIAGVTPSP